MAGASDKRKGTLFLLQARNGVLTARHLRPSFNANITQTSDKTKTIMVSYTQLCTVKCPIRELCVSIVLSEDVAISTAFLDGISSREIRARKCITSLMLMHFIRSQK